jgi:manganese/zinc/iron transport system permease protein
MPSWVVIVLVATAAGLACALCGVFLVLRRGAMVADAISHSVLPGLILGYVVANGPNVFAGLVFATAAGMLAVGLIEALARTRRVGHDTSIGLVFPTLFALGVVVVSLYFSNVHIDTDSVLYGEIATAPFDTLVLGGRDLGSQSLWVLGALTLANAAALAVGYPQFKVSTFDPQHAQTLGLKPSRTNTVLMLLVAATTVGAFNAVGAVLAVALIVAPATIAAMMSRRLPTVVALSALVGVACSLAGYALASAWDVSISGMVATVLGVCFVGALVFAPGQGLAAQWVRRRRLRRQFALDMLVIHLANHEGTPGEETECTVGHVETELGWPRERARGIAGLAEDGALVRSAGERLWLTDAGRSRAARLAQEVGL